MWYCMYFNRSVLKLTFSWIRINIHRYMLKLYITLYIKLTTIDNQAVNRVAIKSLVLASGIVLFEEGGIDLKGIR